MTVTAVAIGLTAGLAPAKEGARARLTTSLSLAATPGKTIRVAWTVSVANRNGGREPFNAIGMFVRLLSRAGETSTTGYASAGAHPDGRYVASVTVPVGGIGGVRAGLSGTTDIFFPIENDPFISAGGVRCDVAALRSTLSAFVRAYNGGDFERLDELFSRERFVWYSSDRPGVRQSGEASDRETLIAYFRARHRHGDRLSALTLRFNGYERQRELGHFELSGERQADDFRGGDWFPLRGKGALDCSKPPVTIAVLSIGRARQ